ncbi:MAG: ubiquitin carboxyl-terminal hydrolase [Clostridiales bacterium]|jgi:hypothetical protein|nr:ubiquitin carboxyl-terminal hydrolase [Clostridiales bacterium]
MNHNTVGHSIKRNYLNLSNDNYIFLFFIRVFFSFRTIGAFFLYFLTLGYIRFYPLVIVEQNDNQEEEKKDEENKEEKDGIEEKLKKELDLTDFNGISKPEEVFNGIGEEDSDRTPVKVGETDDFGETSDLTGMKQASDGISSDFNTNQGLPNSGTDCFVNAAIQLLNNMSLFRLNVEIVYLKFIKTPEGRDLESILNVVMNKTDEGEKNKVISDLVLEDSNYILIAIGKLFKHLNGKKKLSKKELEVCVKILRTVMSSEGALINQQDSGEFIIKILEILGERCGVDNSEISVIPLNVKKLDFNGPSFKNQLYNPTEEELRRGVLENEEKLGIGIENIPLLGKDDLLNILDLNPEIPIAGEEHVEGFKPLSTYKFFLVSRGKYSDCGKGKSEKCMENVDIPRSINIEGVKYLTRGVVAHWGESVLFGHYTLLQQYNGQWFNYNDSLVFQTGAPDEDFKKNFVVLMVVDEEREKEKLKRLKQELEELQKARTIASSL